MKLEKILYGGDYNPEQWLHRPDILEQDIQSMKEAKINTVTLGVFAWSMLEKEEGVYSFEWLETIINNLYDNGIKVILATPSGARPKWLADRYEEVLRVREDGVRYRFGGRHNHCYTSKKYREMVKKIDTELAKRFSNHPAILLWHISNEFGGDCHCELCQTEFRHWLQNKYKTIEALNQSWNTTFWSHRYDSFEQVESPSSIGECAVHGLNLDWKRFVTYQTTDFLKEEIKALKEVGITQPITTNFMYDYQGLNYDVLAKELDVISWDSYPVWHKKEDIVTALDNGFQHDYMRSLKHQPFLLMESCPSSTNWQGVSKLKRPGVLTNASLQAIAHGSDSVLYFQIRQSKGSSEKFHGAVIDHYGKTDTRVFREISSIGESLSNLTQLLGTNTKAEVAIVYDVENRWAMEDAQGPRNKGLHYHESVMKSYRACKKLGWNVDVISEEQDLTNYSLVIAPMLYLFREGMEQKIRAFVKQGGAFVLTYWSGIVDENDSCFLDGTPYGLMDVFGLRRTETDGLYDGEKNRVVEVEGDRVYECETLCDLLEATTAKTLMVYGEEFYKGTPCITEHQYEKGFAYYIGADVEQRFYDDFYKMLQTTLSLKQIVAGTIPDGIEVNSRENEEVEYIFIQNYKNETIMLHTMNVEGELLYGKDKEQLGAYETIILKRKK